MTGRARQEARVRLCDYCGSAYVFGNTRSQYCSVKCRNEEYRARPGTPERALALRRARYAIDSDAQKARAKRTNERIQRFLKAVKTTCGCVDCGTREGKLDFDHRPGTVKEISPSHARSLPRAVREIEKCDVRCGSCHVRRHMAERYARRA